MVFPEDTRWNIYLHHDASPIVETLDKLAPPRTRSQPHSLVLAVINKHGQMPLLNQDVYVNVVGGLRVTETAIDLPVVLAALSSLMDQHIPRDVAVFGEIGLSGEVRPCMNGTERIRQAGKLGFSRGIVPAHNVPDEQVPGMKILGVASIENIVDIIQTL